MKSSRVTEWERSEKTLRDGVSLRGSDDYPLHAQARFSQNLLEQGSHPTSERLLAVLRPASNDVANALGVKEGDNVGEEMVDQAERHAVGATQGAQMNDVVALFHAQRIGNVVAGRTQHRQQPFAGRVTATNGTANGSPALAVGAGTQQRRLA